MVRGAALLTALIVGGACGDGGPEDDAGRPADAGSGESDAGHIDDAGPRECRAPCEGDLRCVDGICIARADGEYDPACETNITVYMYPCSHAYSSDRSVGAGVCNRGAALLPAGQLVRWESAGMLLCEMLTAEAIEPGTCIEVTCALDGSLGSTAAGSTVRVTVDPDDATPECGTARDNSMDSGIALGCE